MYGGNNEGRGITEEIHLTGLRLGVHKSRQAVNLRLNHQNLNHGANKSTEGGSLGTTTGWA